MPPWSARPLEERLQCLAKGYFRVDNRSRADYEGALGSELTPAVWEADKNNNYKILPMAMRAFGHSIGTGSSKDINDWREVLQPAMRNESQLFQESKRKSKLLFPSSAGDEQVDFVVTPINALFTGSRTGTSCEPGKCGGSFCELEHLQSVIQRLASELQNARLDLVSCGHQANKTFRNLRIGGFGHAPFRESFFRVLGLEYGKEPQDWQLLISDMFDEWLDECAGEF